MSHPRLNHLLSLAYLDIIVFCTECKKSMSALQRSSVKRIFQPLSPALNTQLDDAVQRFRTHRKLVDKEAEVCHLIEEKQNRDLVQRNEEIARARERRKYSGTCLDYIVTDSFFQGKGKKNYCHIIEDRSHKQAQPNEKNYAIPERDHGLHLWKSTQAGSLVARRRCCVAMAYVCVLLSPRLSK